MIMPMRFLLVLMHMSWLLVQPAILMPFRLERLVTITQMRLEFPVMHMRHLLVLPAMHTRLQ